jgi:hypothetical protein
MEYQDTSPGYSTIFHLTQENLAIAFKERKELSNFNIAHPLPLSLNKLSK